jgi:thymidine phosphorylase
MVAALGGPKDIVANYGRHLAKAGVVRPAPPVAPGFVQSMDVRAVGLVVVSLGGGRRRAEDHIDFAVGLSEVAGIGERVGKDRPLALVHARNEDEARMAIADLQTAIRVAEDPLPPSPVVRARISG